MSSTDDMDARHGRILAELADAGMDVARGLHAASQRSRDNHELALLAEAFHAVSRSIRQTIALEFKLRHAPRAPAPPKPQPEPAPSPPPVRRDRPEQVCWNEHERADWDEPLDLLLAAGDREAVNTAIDASIARIRRGLATAGRALPATPDSGPTVAEGRDRDPDPPGPPGRRNALLSGASHRAAGFRPARSRDDSGQGGAAVARPRPPWRNSG